MTQPSFPPRFTLTWSGHEASKSVQFEIVQGYLPNGSIHLVGENITPSSGVIRDNKIEFQLCNWDPGKTTVEIHVPSEAGGGRITKRKVELQILSPFYQWQQYGDLSLPEVDQGDQCLLHPTEFKDRILELANGRGKRVLWLSGPPGSGKSFVLRHCLEPKLRTSRGCVLVSRPRRRWEIFAETTKSGVLSIEYRLDPSMPRFLPSHLANYVKLHDHEALLIDDAYYNGTLPDFIFELVLTVSQSEAFHVESFLLVVVDAFPIKRRLEQVKNSDPEAYDFLEPRISDALNDGLIEDVQIDPLNTDQMLRLVSHIIRNRSFTPLQVQQLMELTGGNRYLLACVLDGWTNLYSDTRSSGSVPRSSHLPEAGQRLFDRVCQALAITPEKATEFINWLQQQEGRPYVFSSPRIENRLKYWIEGGVVLRQFEARSRPRYLVPKAFRSVRST